MLKSKRLDLENRFSEAHAHYLETEFMSHDFCVRRKEKGVSGSAALQVGS